MRGYWHFAPALALLALSTLLNAACAPGKGDEPALDLASAEAGLREEGSGDAQPEEMARVLGLDPAAASALRDAFARRDAEVEAWIAGERGQRLIRLEAEMFAAVEARKLDDVKRATAEATPLRDELRQLIADHETSILDSLGPERRVQWEGYEVAKKMLDLMQPLELNFQQAQAIEQGGPAALAQAMRAGEPNPQAAAFLELEKWVEESVLTPDQRAAYQDIKASNKLRSLSI
ncbi:MAG: hypothetical protein KF886_18430 [Candidatus Hydrogenedentes bacterium]|nr:hypothetical protein [Candidatus Hydrogenedentota bacterium]